MVGAALVFVGLSVFYYEYVPEGTFDEDEEDDGKTNEAFDKDEAVEMDDVKLEKEKEALEDENETADF